MAITDQIKTLSANHDKIQEKYKALYEKYEKSKDEDMRMQLRTVAQEALNAAIDLKKIYKELATQDEEKYAKSLAFVETQITTWMDKLTRLGSPISGIPNTTFDEIAGLEDVKQTAKNYLFALKNPSVAKAYNISTNVGMLLYGPPGTGKTLVAKAIAHELGVRFFVITPSMIFGSYVGESERNVRDIFTELRACKDGAVLLVDECESIFARRDGESSRASIGVANQLLQEMNGATDSVDGDKRIIIGATNRPWMMDEAYLRYKRFSIQFYIGMPNEEAIKTVVVMGLKKLPHTPQLEEAMIREFTKVMDTYTCADISGIIEQCAYLAMQDYQRKVESGVKTEFVKIGTEHFNQVLKKFSKSVSKKDLLEYEEFRNSRQA